MKKDMELVLVTLQILGEITGRTRFQKIVFLLKKKFDVAFSYDFVPYYYGPYSADLQHEINLLNLMGFVEVSPSNGIPYTHMLTKKGDIIATKIREEYKNDVTLSRLVSNTEYFRDKSTSALITEAKKLIEYPKILPK